MQQFGQQFIEYHLMPLMEEILTDARKGTKQYLQKELFLTGVLSETSKKDFENYYFLSRNGQHRFPFTEPSQEKERNELISDFVEYIRSRATDPVKRIRFFLPREKDGQITWDGTVRRNLFLMSYSMAQKFEAEKINELINNEKNPEKAQKDRDLLSKGMLILTSNGDLKNPQFNKYISINDLQPTQTVTPFLAPPSGSMAMLIKNGANDSTQYPSTILGTDINGIPLQQVQGSELMADSSRKQETEFLNNLSGAGFTDIGQVEHDAQGNLTVKVKSGNETLSISTDPKTAGPANYHFKFEDGQNKGMQFTQPADKKVRIPGKKTNPKDLNFKPLPGSDITNAGTFSGSNLDGIDASFTAAPRQESYQLSRTFEQIKHSRTGRPSNINTPTNSAKPNSKAAKAETIRAAQERVRQQRFNQQAAAANANAIAADGNQQQQTQDQTQKPKMPLIKKGAMVATALGVVGPIASTVVSAGSDDQTQQYLVSAFKVVVAVVNGIHGVFHV